MPKGGHKMKSTLTFIILCLFSFTVLAQPYAESKMSVDNVLTKYDYLLTSHPQAHEADFKAKTLENFKVDIRASLQGSSKQELQKSFNLILNKIPQKEKREAYLKMIQNMSKESMAAFLANPQLLADSFQGEGANFALITDSVVLDILIISLGLLVVYAIVHAIAEAINYKHYRSSSIYVGYTRDCNSVTMRRNVSDFEIELAKTEAKNKCYANESNPVSRCESDGFSFSESGYDSETGRSDCYARAVYRARK